MKNSLNMEWFRTFPLVHAVPQLSRAFRRVRVLARFTPTCWAPAWSGFSCPRGCLSVCRPGSAFCHTSDLLFFLGPAPFGRPARPCRSCPAGAGLPAAGLTPPGVRPAPGRAYLSGFWSRARLWAGGHRLAWPLTSAVASALSAFYALSGPLVFDAIARARTCISWAVFGRWCWRGASLLPGLSALIRAAAFWLTTRCRRWLAWPVLSVEPRQRRSPTPKHVSSTISALPRNCRSISSPA